MSSKAVPVMEVVQDTATSGITVWPLVVSVALWNASRI